MKRETQKEFFIQAALSGNLSHAYLFSGNDTAYKEDLVRELLRLLAVQTPDRMDIAPGLGESAKEITIAQIRQLAGFAALSPWDSPSKIATMRDAHAMNKEAQSAFLKLLEEPKGATAFFLFTEYPDLLFDTVRSRTQEYVFFSFAPLEVSPRALAEFQNTRSANFIERFAYAKKVADTPEKVSEHVRAWLLAARYQLRKAVEEHSEEAQSLILSITTMQEVLRLLQTSSVNPRLALERVLLDV